MNASGTNRHQRRIATQPRKDLLKLQASWLASARSRLLRRNSIAHRRSILDLGAGYGAVADELVRRSKGLVVAIDIIHESLRSRSSEQSYLPVTGDGQLLPFARHSFDMVFCQCVLLWMNRLNQVITEISRALTPGGVIIIIEPDYEAMIEFPPEVATRELWLEGITNSGGDPIVGRKLPGMLEEKGLEVQVGLLEKIQPSEVERFLFLEGLLETDHQLDKLNRIKQLTMEPDYAGWKTLSHLPFFLITASKKL